MTRLTKILASFFFVGYIPIAPGSFGSAAAIPLSIALAWLAEHHWLAAVAAFVLITVAACPIASRAEVAFGQKDSGRIVIDEVAGYLAATLLLPPSVPVLLAAFVLFRLFDVLKPFPAGWVDRELAGGTGVVLDDVVAGFYTQGVLRVLLALGWL